MFVFNTTCSTRSVGGRNCGGWDASAKMTPLASSRVFRWPRVRKPYRDVPLGKLRNGWQCLGDEGTISRES
ncbi:hypothetical protein E2C01_079256 [Portunus trituberculatus]|uniref:Uncharacterized protein n=1 Tax=Portunus trituberculatus TaxID=210409 RepID=A0A5B7ISU9_PORTR|nr:hypothetical protein [Portunus trituberculatus]